MPRILKIDIVCSHCDHTITAHINKESDEHNNINLGHSILLMGIHEEREHGTVSE